MNLFLRVLWLWALLFTALPLRALEAPDLQHPPIKEWQQQLDDAEARLKSGDLHDEDAVALRDRLLLLDSRLREMRDAALERAALIGHDLDALGPAPKDGETPEAPRLSSRRKALQDQMAAQDAGAKESDLLLSRLSRVLSEIKSLRRERLTQRILTRSFGTLDPLNWQRTAPEWRGFVGAILTSLKTALEGGAGLPMWQRVFGCLALFVLFILRWRLGPSKTLRCGPVFWAFPHFPLESSRLWHASGRLPRARSRASHRRSRSGGGGLSPEPGNHEDPS